MWEAIREGFWEVLTTTDGICGVDRPIPEEPIDPLTGKPLVFGDNGLPMVALEPGTMQELAPGEEVEFNNPPGTAADYPNFMKQQLMAIAAGIGLPYELLSGDMAGVSDRALRLIINEFRRRIQQIQHNQIIFQFCRPVWNRWLDMDLFDEFGVTQQTHDFKFSSTTTDVRAQGVKARRLVDDALGALPYNGLHAFCGSEFFDALVGHKSVKEAYQRWQDGEALRNDPKGRFRFADIDWEEYRGSVGGNDFVAANEAYLYPTGADIFKIWFAPADFVETVNTIGLPLYAKQKVMDFEKGVIIHTQSNPLPINLRPRAVIKLTMS